MAEALEKSRVGGKAPASPERESEATVLRACAEALRLERANGLRHQAAAREAAEEAAAARREKANAEDAAAAFLGAAALLESGVIPARRLSCY